MAPPSALQDRDATPEPQAARVRPAGEMAGEVGVSLIGLLELLFENRRLLLGLPLAIAAVLALFWVFDEPEYEATSRFLTEESRNQPSGLSGAAQLFMSFSGGGAGEPLTFYPELIRSTEILKAAAAAEYEVATEEGDTVPVTLAAVYDIPESGDREGRIKATAGKLAQDVEVTINSGARMVVLTTTAERPELAVQVNRTLLDLVHAWNLERRESQARAEREFLEERLSEAQAELREAEAEMQRFLEQNRRYQQSPELTFQLNRLQRRVDLVQQRYVAMAQSYDQARAEEVRHTPLINIVDRPSDTVHRVRGSLVLRVLFGLVAGFLLAVLVVLAREYVRYELREKPHRYDRLRQRLRATWGPLARILPRRASRSA